MCQLGIKPATFLSVQHIAGWARWGVCHAEKSTRLSELSRSRIEPQALWLTSSSFIRTQGFDGTRRWTPFTQIS
ncbi:hypothetical protein RRG08_066627 [Elysia crispata]|uniref:Uncharacterized protein n=1 Tax=Elysia crispata TaxID=231223 RepID=A0AAE1B7U2_9GAST|nr:hypothetical protein RRG08_066627 [Elysia crispata]